MEQPDVAGVSAQTLVCVCLKQDYHAEEKVPGNDKCSW